MSNETDLGWLARNVHNWPAGHQGWCYVISNRDGTKGVATSLIGQVDCPWVRIEKQEWLTRRAELQNKPSWDDAPSDMKWLAQDSDGQWCWYCSEPFVDETNDDNVWGFGDSFDHEDCEFGEVLGDWRDTLEKRPEQKAFEPFVSIEDNQEQDMAQQQEMKQDNGWFERGELPPVGTACEAFGKFPTAPCEIIAYSPEQVAIRWLDNGLLDVIDLKTGDIPSIDFRPIRTERDVLIEIIKQWDGLVQTDDVLADAILAAGFKRGTA